VALGQQSIPMNSRHCFEFWNS